MVGDIRFRARAGMCALVNDLHRGGLSRADMAIMLADHVSDAIDLAVACEGADRAAILAKVMRAIEIAPGEAGERVEAA